MGIAGENRVTCLSSSRLRKFYEANRLDDLGIEANELQEMLARLAQMIPGKLEDMFEENGEIPHVAEFADKVLLPVRQVCERSLARLSD